MFEDSFDEWDTDDEEEEDGAHYPPREPVRWRDGETREQAVSDCCVIGIASINIHTLPPFFGQQ